MFTKKKMANVLLSLSLFTIALFIDLEYLSQETKAAVAEREISAILTKQPEITVTITDVHGESTIHSSTNYKLKETKNSFQINLYDHNEE